MHTAVVEMIYLCNKLSRCLTVFGVNLFFVLACCNPTDVRLKMRSNLLARSLGHRDVGFRTFTLL